MEWWMLPYAVLVWLAIAGLEAMVERWIESDYREREVN